MMTNKQHTFKVVINEGKDGFWEVEGKSGVKDVEDLLTRALQSMFIVGKGQECELSLMKNKDA